MTLGHSFPNILAAARTGAEWAWTQIYEELAPAVTGYLTARGAPEPTDLASEVFLQIVRDLPSFEGDEPQFRAWAFTIAHRRLLDDSRYRARRPVEPTPHVPLAGEACAETAEDEALRELSAQRVRRILAGLSTDQQSVLLLRIIGDLTVQQVAGVLGKSPGAVKALQRRALAMVERELATEGRTPFGPGDASTGIWTIAST
ncbi:MAG TPA: sigma-70 family RNA polymerase sigma factor [Thermoleophilaceae bacterium]|nr:sigma-70 family RNA polymerase sigma factor [Thermoleophilaceae bacterium]